MAARKKTGRGRGKKGSGDEREPVAFEAHLDKERERYRMGSRTTNYDGKPTSRPERNPPPLIQLLQENSLERRGWLRFRVATELRIKAVCRAMCEGDKDAAKVLFSTLQNDKKTHPLKEVVLQRVTPLLGAMVAAKTVENQVVSRIEKLTEKLPVWRGWAERVHGVGAKSVGLIAGEAGDLNEIERPSQLWTLLGVGLVPRFQGDPDPPIQQRMPGDAGILHKFNPERRAVVFTLGDSFIKTGGPYRDVYDRRKIVELKKFEDAGYTVVPAAEMPKQGDPERDKYRSQGHVHNRARRYTEKQFLKHLLWAWHDCGPVPRDVV